ncbi:MAG: DUF3373 family protein [Thermodesulfobacteriota bacterium]
MKRTIARPTMLLTVLGMLLLPMLIPSAGSAGEETETLKKEIEALKEELADMDDRLNQTELHTATDKISLGLELRSRYDYIRYNDVYTAPMMLRQGFFTPVALGGMNGATLAQIRQGMAMAGGMKPDEYTAENDAIFTNRLRLNMDAKLNSSLSFSGRLAMYKVYGDSSGVKFMSGNLNDVALDGNTASLPQGDALHVERAYFNYKNDLGSVPINLSLGRRPATDGPPLEYGNYSPEGGSPLGTIINWQFDGASFNFGLEDASGISGAAFKLCYGVGFESDWGNSYSLNGSSYVDDATFGGFIATFYDDEVTSMVLNYAHAWDITDGFTGTVVMPFIPTKNPDGTYTFAPNTGGYISRMEAATNIGDFDLASLLFRTNFAERFADIDFFLAPSWSHTRPSEISRNAYYEMMGQGLVSTADATGALSSENGYSVYTGVLLPMPMDARLGLEYNWGSQYWFNMTGAEDSLVGSKLSARGQVYEAYYIQPVFKDNFFLKLGGRYYDYEYTGSGNPLGEPVKISELKATDAFFPVVDTVWNVYLSATIRL